MIAIKPGYDWGDPFGMEAAIDPENYRDVWFFHCDFREISWMRTMMEIPGDGRCVDMTALTGGNIYTYQTPGKLTEEERK